MWASMTFWPEKGTFPLLLRLKQNNLLENNMTYGVNNASGPTFHGSRWALCLDYSVDIHEGGQRSDRRGLIA